MEPRRIVNIPFQGIKIIFLAIILCLLLIETEIHQNPLNDSNENRAKSFKFRGWLNFFCTVPAARSIGSVPTNDIEQSLNIPNNATFYGWLYKFGECQAKALKINENPEKCLCYPDPIFIAMIAFASVCLVGNLMLLVKAPFGKNSGYTFVTAITALIWFSLATAAFLLQLLTYEEFVLQKSNGNDQNFRYFKPVINWWCAIAFAYAYSIIGSMEAFCFERIVHCCVINSNLYYGKVQNLNRRKRRLELIKLEHYQDEREACENKFLAVQVSSGTWP